MWKPVAKKDKDDCALRYCIVAALIATVIIGVIKWLN